MLVHFSPLDLCDFMTSNFRFIMDLRCVPLAQTILYAKQWTTTDNWNLLEKCNDSNGFIIRYLWTVINSGHHHYFLVGNFFFALQDPTIKCDEIKNGQSLFCTESRWPEKKIQTFIKLFRFLKLNWNTRQPYCTQSSPSCTEYKLFKL